jgi:hypothetical protein
MLARYLTSKVQFQSHARRIGIEDLLKRDVRILDTRTDPALREAIWSLHLAIMLHMGALMTLMCKLPVRRIEWVSTDLGIER